MMSELCGVREAAAICDCSENTIYRAIKKGDITPLAHLSQRIGVLVFDTLEICKWGEEYNRTKACYKKVA